MDCTRDFAKRKIAGTISFLNLHKKYPYYPLTGL